MVNEAIATALDVEMYLQIIVSPSIAVPQWLGVTNNL